MRRNAPGLMFSLVLPLIGCASTSADIGSPRAATLPVAAAGTGIPGGEVAEEAIQDTIDLSKEEWIELEASPGAAELLPGARAVASKKWLDARKFLETALAGMEGATIDQRFAGQALLGRACDFLKDREAAEKAYSRILDEWKGEPTVREAIASAGNDEKKRRESVQRVLLAVGEALYFMAELKRDDVDDARPPGYTG
ncbi:MAG: hypothetical protein JNK04_01555, partial [Myxococcales bacterium]|nr:hypothetical protein [Myxococcales bacterium]